MSDYLKQRMEFINAGRPLKEKKRYVIPKVSPKRQKQLKEQKQAGGDSDMDLFFQRTRKYMVGTCQCGCAKPTQKNDDTFYRHCIAHIFPKRLFKSIATNPLNWVERAFWGGCHSVMDDTSMDKWVNMADFDDIKEKFHQLAPLLTDEERATKFYAHLERLIYKQ